MLKLQQKSFIALSHVLKKRLLFCEHEEKEKYFENRRGKFHEVILEKGLFPESLISRV